MRFLKITIILLLVFGCQKSKEKHIAIGSWNICHENGHYSEYKITDNYVINLTSEYDEFWFFKSKISDSSFTVSSFNIGSGITEQNDILETVQNTNNIIILRRYDGEKLELERADFDYDDIDSTNLKLWKNKTLTEFKKRAKLAGCRDIRTENEKVVPTLDLENYEEE